MLIKINNKPLTNLVNGLLFVLGIILFCSIWGVLLRDLNSSAFVYMFIIIPFYYFYTIFFKFRQNIFLIALATPSLSFLSVMYFAISFISGIAFSIATVSVNSVNIE